MNRHHERFSERPEGAQRCRALCSLLFHYSAVQLIPVQLISGSLRSLEVVKLCRCVHILDRTLCSRSSNQVSTCGITGDVWGGLNVVGWGNQGHVMDWGMFCYMLCTVSGDIRNAGNSLQNPTLTEAVRQH